MTPDLNPSHSRARGLARRDHFQVSRAQDFQVPVPLQASTLGEYHLPSTTECYAPTPWQAWLPFYFLPHPSGGGHGAGGPEAGGSQH